MVTDSDWLKETQAEEPLEWRQDRRQEKKVCWTLDISHIYTRRDIFKHVYIYIYIYIHKYVFAYEYIHLNIDIYIYIYILHTYMYSCGSPHMAAQKQGDQLKRTFSSYVRIQGVVLKTYLGRWTIGRSGERGSGISVLPARYDDDDDTHTYIHTHYYI